jgi:hypothetical protein
MSVVVGTHIDVTKTKKGKNFKVEEESQPCRSFLHVNQDAIVSNGQRSITFWDLHYNNLRLDGYVKQLPRSLETKWGIIEHNVSKFVGVYGSVISLNELGSSIEDTLHKTLELYKLEHSKNLELCFIHCWLLLKDVPRWSDLLEDFKKTLAMKRPCPYV